MFRNPTADLLVVLLIVLLIFGPKRLPGLGKSIGHGIREFKDGITGKSTVDEDERPELTAASATPPAATNDRDAAEVASPERRS
ncbi:MAG TPA: twin-arginine translocase TatA/TatE family subunit [Solirubrobacteraceae bacterium]|jgi:sec-independent protein translocase protein TatA|nr:twin-arginine translocase TatA/TatE family subunit [Solirubrobacteraceae bacterium]